MKVVANLPDVKTILKMTTYLDGILIIALKNNEEISTFFVDKNFNIKEVLPNFGD